LYNVSMGQIMDEDQLSMLFRAPGRNDIILLEDIDCAGIAREKMITQTTEPESDERSDHDTDQNGIPDTEFLRRQSVNGNKH
jgi:hypothetical protein